jgi:hypothetical protein
VHRALAQIPKQGADQAPEAQLVRLQAVRMLLWNQANADPIRVAEAHQDRALFRELFFARSSEMLQEQIAIQGE